MTEKRIAELKDLDISKGFTIDKYHNKKTLRKKKKLIVKRQNKQEK